MTLQSESKEEKVRLRRWSVLLLGIGILAAAVAFSFVRPSRSIKRIGFALTQSRDRGAIVFLGDSIVAGWQDLTAAFPEWKVANRGLNGDRTIDVLHRLQADALSLEPAGFVLLVGTNDLNGGKDPSETMVNLRAIVQQIHRRSPEIPIVVCKVMPRALSAGRFPEKILRLNALLEELPKEVPGTQLLDTWTLFADEHGGPRQEDFPDLLHPGVQGYAKWAASLRPVLKAALTKREGSNKG